MEHLTQEQLAEATDREQQRNQQWPTLSLEQKIEALNTRITDERDRLYSYELPQIDEQIQKAFHEACEASDKSTNLRGEVARELRDIISQAKGSLKHEVTQRVNELIKQATPDLFKTALTEVFKSVVLKTRPATREESRTGDNVIVVRQATRGEI